MSAIYTWMKNSHYDAVVTPGDASHVQTVVITSTEKPKTCKYCGSDKVYVQKTVPDKTFFDLYADPNSDHLDGTPSRIIVKRKRFRCDNCKKTFFPEDSIPKEKISIEYKKVVVEEILSRHEVTNTNAAEKFGLGKSTVSDIINDAMIKASENTICVKLNVLNLAFVPFDYDNKTHCAVIGSKIAADDLILLDFLDTYEVDTIIDFCQNKIMPKACVDLVFTMPDRDLINGLMGIFSRADCCILMDYVLDHITIADDGNGVYYHKMDAMKEIQKILKDSKIEQLERDLYLWKKTLIRDPDQIDVPKGFKNVGTAFDELINCIDNYTEECINAWSYGINYNECSKFLGIIDSFRKNNVPYDMMKFRIMYSDLGDCAFDFANKNYINGIQCLYSRKVTDYGVKIKDIVDFFQ